MRGLEEILMILAIVGNERVRCVKCCNFNGL